MGSLQLAGMDLQTPHASIPARAVAKCLRNRSVGRPVSKALHALGMESASRWSSRHSGFVPAIAPVRLASGRGGFRMYSAEGNDYIVRELWAHGLSRYEPPLPRIYELLVRGATEVLDVGANSGFYALLAAHAAPQARVHAFEPFPDALRWLRANLELNNVQHRVVVNEAAAGDAQGSFKLYVPEKRFGETLETSSSLESDFRPKHHAVIDVRVETLDAYAAQAQLQSVALLRADVEGAEYRVLGGARRVLDTFRPFVFVEVLSAAAAEKVRPFAEAANYAVFSLEDRGVRAMTTEAHVPGNTNHLWCPQERVPDMRSIFQGDGLDVR